MITFLPLKTERASYAKILCKIGKQTHNSSSSECEIEIKDDKEKLTSCFRP